MATAKILIVEDEILIADNLKRYLIKKGYDVVGIAISYDEAKELYVSQTPDVALIDIRLHGPKSGIDFATYLQQQQNTPPFIFLTSQFDQHNIKKATATYPSAYLSKPIRKESLIVAIDIALQGHYSR